MFTTDPMPGNPWPHDMLITIEDDVHALLDLLWIREAWRLDPIGEDLPPHLVATPAQEPAFNELQVEAWANSWPEIWRACVSHAGEERDPLLIGRLQSSPLASQERTELLAQLVGPSWQDSFGDAAFTDGYDVWNSNLFQERTTPRTSRSPERESLEQLVPAWRAGLTKIIVIPCHGSFTRRIGAHALLVTAETRGTAERYAEALSSFG